MYGGRRTRRRTMRSRRTRIMRGRRTRRMRAGKRTRRPRTRRPRTRRPRTRRSFMMYGGERVAAVMGGSTFIRHSSLNNAEVNVKLLPKDGGDAVVTGKIHSNSINNIAPFQKGTDIHYENMKWEVMVQGFPTLTIPGEEFMKEADTKPSKIVLIYKEKSSSGQDELKYKMMHDDKTMDPTKAEVLEYVNELISKPLPIN